MVELGEGSGLAPESCGQRRLREDTRSETEHPHRSPQGDLLASELVKDGAFFDGL